MKKTNNKPLVSVIMPVYNSQEFIEKALSSVVDQTFQDFELIIVDDASTDKTLRIAKKFQKKYPSKIKIIALSDNLGAGGDHCANIALDNATGKYIARMDADDICYPTRLDKQVRFLEENKDIFLVGSNAYVIDKKGIVIGEKKEPLSSDEIYNAYFGFHPLIHPTCTFRRVLADSTPFRYEIKHSANNDYYTFFKLICQGYKFVNLEEKLIKYRIHGNNATFVNMKHKFVNSLKIRLAMVANYNYIPSPKAVIMVAIQTGVVFIFPEKVLLNIYFLAKGIVKLSELTPSISIPRLIPAIRKAFSI